MEGHRTFASVLDVPDAIDMATVYVQPDVGVRVMEDLAKKGVHEVWLNPGADDDAVVAHAKKLETALAGVKKHLKMLASDPHHFV